MSSLREIAFKIALLDVLSRRVKAALAEERRRGEPLFAEARRTGSKQLEVALPSGEAVGSISIKAGKDTTRVDDAALMEWVRKNAPDEIEPVVSNSALARPDVVAYVRRFHPDLVADKVRPSYRAKLLGQLNADGKLVDEETGEVTKIAEVVRGAPTGEFMLTFDPAKGGRPNGRDRVAQAWADGEISLPEVLLPQIEAGGAE